MDSAKSNRHFRFNQDPHFRRQVETLYRLGPRPVGEFVAEIVARLAEGDPDRLAFVEARLSRYAALDPGIVAALGGDRFAPRPLTLIDGGRP